RSASAPVVAIGRAWTRPPRSSCATGAPGSGAVAVSSDDAHAAHRQRLAAMTAEQTRLMELLLAPQGIACGDRKWRVRVHAIFQQPMVSRSRLATAMLYRRPRRRTRRGPGASAGARGNSARAAGARGWAPAITRDER